MKEVRLIAIGNICGNAVCVAPLRGVQCTPGTLPNASLYNSHLHVVHSDGSLFTEQEFYDMGVVDQNASQVKNLCSQNIESLTKAFLPHNAIEPMVHGECFYTDSGVAHVQFLISGYVITR